SVPTSRPFKTASSTPAGRAVSERRAPEESRPACARGDFPLTASAQFVCTRSSGRIGWAILQVVGIDPVTGVGANPNETGSGLGRSVTVEVEPPKKSRGSRSPVVPQFGGELPPPGRGSRDQRIRFRSCLFPRQRFCFWATQPLRKRFTSNGTCLRHRWYTARPIFASRIDNATRLPRFFSCRCIHALTGRHERIIRHAASKNAHFRWALPIFLPPVPFFVPALSWAQRTRRE